VLSKINLPSKHVLAHLRNLREEVRTLGNPLREIKARENPILQSEIARLREAVTALDGSVDRLTNAKTMLTDEGDWTAGPVGHGHTDEHEGLRSPRWSNAASSQAQCAR
jgi:hypothetical protein